MYINTDAKNQVNLRFDNYSNYYNKYDYIYTELSKNLNNEASK